MRLSEPRPSQPVWMDIPSAGWRLGLGAEVLAGGVRFRVWAPKRRRVEVVIDDRTIPLDPETGGYFTATVPGISAGALYWYRLDGDRRYPDPCSRFQPGGPHGPSLIVDPDAYAWNDTAWRGIAMRGQVIYELHVGTFTPEGTFDAAARELAELARLGVTLIELMPVAEFPGRWNWGYDGVDLYAPAHVYGDPQALKRFVDRAHALGLGVILDTVYNHLGPDGNYLGAFSDEYFTDRYPNEWGQAVNFDGPGSKAVREYVIRNACYWVVEYHLDGLRLDATQSIFDGSPIHLLAELSACVRKAAAPRTVVLTAEDERQRVIALRPVDRGGYGFDAVWSDDFHHAARVALTGRREAYYSDYRGTPQEFVSIVKGGFLYQGQLNAWQQQPRGSVVTDEPGSGFVFYLQNHDQVANHVAGTRLHLLSSPGRYRALTALLLLAPQTPLLFMGQEFGASAPFVFFADHQAELAGKVLHGRRAFLGQFPSYATEEAQRSIADPAAASTFEQAKLDVSQRARHLAFYRLHEDLLRLRRGDPVISAQARDRLDGAVLGPESFVLRFYGGQGEDRLLIVNLGPDVVYDPSPEPLLAPVAGRIWSVLWSSEALRYGGSGAADPYRDGRWLVPAASATVFAAAPAAQELKR